MLAPRAEPDDLERLELVGRLEAEDLAEERQARLERTALGDRAAEAVALALEREVGIRDAVGGQRRHHRLGLRRRDDAVVEPLEQEDRARDVAGGVDRRTLPVEGRGLRVRGEQAVVVARLELVGLDLEELQVADPVVADARGEDVPERERREGRVAAGASALDGQPPRIGVAPADQVAGSRDAIVDVDDPPLAVEPAPVLAAVAGAPAVVHVHDGDAAAGQELPGEIERGQRVRRGAAMRQHDERRAFPLGRDELGVRRRVEQGVRGPLPGRRELDRLGLRDRPRVEGDRARPAQDARRRERQRIEPGDDPGIGRGTGQRDDRGGPDL